MDNIPQPASPDYADARHLTAQRVEWLCLSIVGFQRASWSFHLLAPSLLDFLYSPL